MNRNNDNLEFRYSLQKKVAFNLLSGCAIIISIFASIYFIRNNAFLMTLLFLGLIIFIILGLIYHFIYKIRLKADYIEQVGFRLVRIYFKDINMIESDRYNIRFKAGKKCIIIYAGLTQHEVIIKMILERLRNYDHDIKINVANHFKIKYFSNWPKGGCS